MLRQSESNKQMHALGPNTTKKNFKQKYNLTETNKKIINVNHGSQYQ